MTSAPGRLDRRTLGGLAAAAAAAGLALVLAVDGGVVGVGAVGEVARVIVAALVLWGVSGWALARWLCPPEMAAHRPLLALPLGAASSALALTVLGYAGLPFGWSLAAVLVAGAGAALWAEFRPRHSRDRPPGPARAGGRAMGGPMLRLGWPLFVAGLCVAVMLVPVFRSGFATVVGTGGDVHLSVATVEFVAEAHPASTAPETAADMVPLPWRSKVPIYYGSAAVTELAGLEAWQSVAPLSALLTGLALLGVFFLVVYGFGATPVAGLVAAGIVGLGETLFFSTNHPYFNQAWGFAAMPWAVALGLLAVTRPRPASWAAFVLVLTLGGFAYPLMLPFPLLAVGVAGVVELRSRSRGGRPLDWRAPLRRLPRSPLMVPVYVVAGLLLALPALGVFEKLVSGAAVVFGFRSLAPWAADVLVYFPAAGFLSGPASTGAAGIAFAAVVSALAMVGLWRAPPAARAALGATIAAAAAFALVFRLRDFGWYFYFKTLTFLGPLVIAAGVAGLAALWAPHRARIVRLGAVTAACAWVGIGALAVRDRIDETVPQVHENLVELAAWQHELIPEGASVRLDVDPETQPWISYFLQGRPLTTRDPLTWTQYPHVVPGRKADFVLADPMALRPFDASGEPLAENANFVLYRMSPDVPGEDLASRRLVHTVTSVPLF